MLWQQSSSDITDISLNINERECFILFFVCVCVSIHFMNFGNGYLTYSVAPRTF